MLEANLAVQFGYLIWWREQFGNNGVWSWLEAGGGFQYNIATLTLIRSSMTKNELVEKLAQETGLTKV
jgi:hypothetical protein